MVLYLFSNVLRKILLTTKYKNANVAMQDCGGGESGGMCMTPRNVDIYML